MKQVLIIATVIAMTISVPVLARGVGHSHTHYGYQGGHYAGGVGSSHKGGHYKNARTNNHYTHHKG